jgi:hypothetical protein
MSTPLLLAALTPDGTAGRLQILDPYEEFPAPVGAPAATCQVCRRPIYHRDDGMWTLGWRRGGAPPTTNWSVC